MHYRYIISVITPRFDLLFLNIFQKSKTKQRIQKNIFSNVPFVFFNYFSIIVVFLKKIKFKEIYC